MEGHVGVICDISVNPRKKKQTVGVQSMTSLIQRSYQSRINKIKLTIKRSIF